MEAFLQAGTYSFVAITLLLVAVLRRVRDVVLTMLPVMLSGLLRSPPARPSTSR